MIFNPHKLGIHKVLKYIPLNAIFDAPYKRALKRAVNIADLRTIAKSRAHKVSYHPCVRVFKAEWTLPGVSMDVGFIISAAKA